MPYLHIPQNFEIPPKPQIFSKTPPRFAHWGDQNLKPIQTDRAWRALSNGYDFIWFKSLDPLRKGKSTSQCWVCFFVRAVCFFWKTWKLHLQGHFLRNIILQRKLVKNVFCIYFSVYVAFLLSVREQGASAIIQFIILSLLEIFRSFGEYASMEFE